VTESLDNPPPPLKGLYTVTANAAEEREKAGSDSAPVEVRGSFLKYKTIFVGCSTSQKELVKTQCISRKLPCIF